MSYDDDDDYVDYDDNQVLYTALKHQIRKASKKSEERDEKLAQAFTRVADALERLTQEVKGLREDLNPQLDKPAKMPAPKQGG